MPGPAPKTADQRRRKNATVPMNRLPKGGRVGPLPKWPLSKATPAESSFWRSLWAMPQAMVWENQRLERIVARYCRLTIESEQRGAPSTLRSEARQMEDKLLLNPAALKKAYYEIDADEVSAKRDQSTGPTTSRRLKAVDTGAVAGA